MDCTKCGTTHQPKRCVGHTRDIDGKLHPCGNWPIRGGTVCRSHGGSAVQVRAGANRRLEERELARTLGMMGESIPTSDGEALQELRDRYRGIVRALWLLAGGLQLIPAEDAAVAAGRDGVYVQTFHQTGRATGEARPHVVLVMLGDWSDRLAKIDEACVRLGLAERRVRVEEAEAVLLAGAVDVMLAAVVPSGLHGRCREVLAAELRRLDAGPAGGKVA